MSGRDDTDWYKEAAEREAAHGDPECTVMPPAPLTSNEIAARAKDIADKLLIEPVPRAWLLQALRESADEIGRLNAVAGPSGKGLGELETINDGLIEENEQLRQMLQSSMQSAGCIVNERLRMALRDARTYLVNRPEIPSSLFDRIDHAISGDSPSINSPPPDALLNRDQKTTMGENSAIEWTTHTFDPWVGCTKVSPGCDHCYAEGWAKRSGLVRARALKGVYCRECERVAKGVHSAARLEV